MSDEERNPENFESQLFRDGALNFDFDQYVAEAREDLEKRG